MLRFLLLLCCCIGLLAACQPTATPSDSTPSFKKAIAMPTQVSIKIGELGPDFLKRYPDLVKVQHQSAGVDFYEINWDSRPRGILFVEHGKHSFAIEDVLGISSMQDLKELSLEGLSEFDIYAGITEPDLIPHDEARLKTHAILQHILQAGWQPIVMRDNPRITGKDQQAFMFATSNVNGLDPRYLPSFEEWMRIEDRTAWNFYADHLYLSVCFTREKTLRDPLKPGSYLLEFNIKTEAEEFRIYVGPDNRQKWKEKLPAELARLPAIRVKKEAELRAKGIKIDETYQDPPVPDFK